MNTNILKVCIGLVILSVQTQAQSALEALRYSQTFSGGTARNISLGGSMYASGGDISTISFNPAGLAQFKASEASVTLGLSTIQNKATFLSNTESASKLMVQMPSWGLVFVNNRENKSWKTHAFAISMQRLHDFNDKISYSGYNTQSSIVRKWIENANGISLNTLTDDNSFYQFEEGLAYNTYLIDTLPGTGNNFEYGGVVLDNVLQSTQLKMKGSMNEMNIAYAANYKEKVLVGASINIPFFNYNEVNSYTESDTANVNSVFKELVYNKNLSTQAVGVNANIGVMVKPTNYLRIGAFLKTPSYFRLNDTYSSKMNAKYEGFDEQNAESSIGKYSYNLVTPMQIGASVCAISNKWGLINGGIIYSNNSATNYLMDDANFEAELNKDIQKYAQNSIQTNVGVEGKYKIYRARVGYAYTKNAYKNSLVASNQFTAYSFGLGIQENDWFLNLSYQIAQNKSNKFPYTTPIQNFESKITRQQSVLSFTFGLKM